MKDENNYITISPDFDFLYQNPDGVCDEAYGDEIANDDFSFGPRFRIVVPGIEEWHRRYVVATDFAETETDASFDWKRWHYEGLLFAKEIKRQLPSIYKLYYQTPYEDNVELLDDEIEITDDIDDLILSLKTESPISCKPSMKDNVVFTVNRQEKDLAITACLGHLKVDFEIPNNRIKSVKDWLLAIIDGEEDAIQLYLPSAKLHFFPQRIGIHTDMGRFWIEKKDGSMPELAAYVNAKEFVKGIYLTLMSTLGFYIYPSREVYPEGKEREECWKPYNELKSIAIENFINDIETKAENQAPFITETYVIFPDYGDCMFWNTMGVGCGNHEDISLDESTLPLKIKGLKEWYDKFDFDDPIEDFDEYWEEGWRLALLVRRFLPSHADLYYMSYDPSKPDEHRDYSCNYPKIIVPHTREIYKDFPKLEESCQKEWESKKMIASRDYVFARTSKLLSFEEGIGIARDSFLQGADVAKEELESGISESTMDEYIETVIDKFLAQLDSAMDYELKEIAVDAFSEGYNWHKQSGQHIFVDSEATYLLKDSVERTIYNAVPKQQWDNRPGNAPTPGFEGVYKFLFNDNKTKIKVGDRVVLHPHEKPGWERTCLFRVKDITKNSITIDTEWAVLKKCDLWDIELVEVSK